LPTSTASAKRAGLNGPANTGGAPRRGRIWLADDSAGQLAYTLELLAEEHDVEAFSDGALLLERLAQPGVGFPELLLLDWHMPGVSGLEVCRFLRERFTHAELPILVLTAKAQPGDLEEAFDAGANDYVSKPVRAVTLRARIRTLLQVHRHDAAHRVHEVQRERLLADAQAARDLSETALWDLRVATEARRETEERLRRVVEASGTGTWELDVASGHVTADARHLTLLGLPQGTVLTRASSLASLHTEDRERVSRAVSAALAGENGGRFCVEFRSGGAGEALTQWVEARGQTHVDAQGKVLRLLGTAVDISARKRAEVERQEMMQEVEAVHTRLANLFESAPAFVCTLRGPRHAFELVNPLYQCIVGVNREVLGLNLEDALPEMVGKDFTALLDRVYRTGEPYIGREMPVSLDRHADGKLESAYISFVYQPTRSAQGEVEGIDVFGFEVTEQVLARQRAESNAHALWLSEERSRLVESAAGVAVWEVDLVTQVLQTDALMRSFCGLNPGEELPLERMLALVHPEDRERVVAGMTEAFRREASGAYHVEYRLPLPNGAWRWVEARGRAYFGGDDQVVRFLGTLVDISARKEAEAAVLRSAEFEQQLIGIVSHDLRNPLSAVLMGAQFMLREGGLSGRQVRNLARIQASAERAQRLISDLLDFTQARLGGGLRVSPEALDLHALVRQGVDEVQLSHAERDIHVVHEGDGQGYCDSDRITQVLGNLLANALSYSPKNTRVRVTTRGEPGALVLQVHNMGTPIPPELLARLFEPMQRGVQTRSRERSVGLGLYIVDQLVRAHGGEVKVESGELEGTTFAVRLPHPLPSA
jgi:PAS domain S-box-containing protein